MKHIHIFSIPLLIVGFCSFNAWALPDATTKPTTAGLEKARQAFAERYHALKQARIERVRLIAQQHPKLVEVKDFIHEYNNLPNNNDKIESSQVMEVILRAADLAPQKRKHDEIRRALDKVMSGPKFQGTNPTLEQIIAAVKLEYRFKNPPQSTQYYSLLLREKNKTPKDRSHPKYSEEEVKDLIALAKTGKYKTQESLGQALASKYPNKKYNKNGEGYSQGWISDTLRGANVVWSEVQKLYDTLQRDALKKLVEDHFNASIEELAQLFAKTREGRDCSSTSSFLYFLQKHGLSLRTLRAEGRNKAKNRVQPESSRQPTS